MRVVDFRPDIGMYSIDRAASSCVHATEFCRKNCYVRKFYLLGRIKPGRDSRIESFWYKLTAKSLQKILSRKRHQTKRIRLASRGEILASFVDVLKVRRLCLGLPDVQFWLPTRAWRQPGLRILCETLLFPFKNLHIMASTDPSNSREEMDMLKRNGWSTYFFGDNEIPPFPKMLKCPKTWQNRKGYCPFCSEGCFSGKQVHVWSKMKARGKMKDSSWNRSVVHDKSST